MKKPVFAIIAVFVLGGLVWAVGFLNQKTPSEDVTEPDLKLPVAGVNETDFPLNVPAGFSISVFADNLPGARVMTRDVFGNFWVSQTGEGVVSLVEVDQETGKAARVSPIFRGLNRPHGLAFHPESDFLLYIAEENGVSRVGTYSSPRTIQGIVRGGDTLHKVVELPSGGGHFTRTIAFGPDNRLYVSVGSSCNVCEESDDRRAKIFSMMDDGSDFKEFARGLRNTVFFTWSYIDGKMWGTDMGRDNLGDNLPPDEINIIEEGGNYGWPVCYGKNIHDTDFDKNTYIRNPCSEPFEKPAQVEIPAHSAPLGLAFVPEEGWPEDWWYDLVVAYHGSWNRSEKTGYKLTRIKLDAEGNYEGAEDFITGWFSDGEVYGRPVDVRVESGGVMYVTDDKAGLIYKIKYLSDWSVRNFEECVSAGYPVAESYPRQCREPGGKLFVENIGNELEKLDLIRIENPRPNQVIASPLTIRGEARGNWFFEASFPVKLYDANGGNITLNPSYITASSEWMTADFVPFEATLEFKAPAADTGTLVLEKDNPSGLPEHADSLSIPVRFR